MPAWPPTLEDLKSDRAITDSRDDARLDIVLAAAARFVENVRRGEIDFDAGRVLDDDADPPTALPLPGPDLRLGTVRLAYRWHERRMSPAGLVDMGELGSTRVPSFDPDIEQLLGIGRYTPVRFA